jgi:hypothetical protein
VKDARRLKMKKQTDYFKIALEEVLKVREQRRKIYGDTWREMEDWETLAFIKQKYKRLHEFVINKSDNNTYESEKDTLIDLTNYTLFMLANLEAGKDEQNK